MLISSIESLSKDGRDPAQGDERIMGEKLGMRELREERKGEKVDL